MVRTAVSRLVAANRLNGEREGRRSYYRLSDSAQTEFLLAASRIYGRRPRQDWCFIWLADTGQEPALAHLELAGFRRLASNWFLGPQAHLPPQINAVMFDAQTQAPRAMLQAMAGTFYVAILISRLVAVYSTAEPAAAPGANRKETGPGEPT